MLRQVNFDQNKYKLVITNHALIRMEQRGIRITDLLEVIEKGVVKPKSEENRKWVYRKLKGRKDNMVCASISIEDPFLIVVTTLINWRPS